MPKQRTYHILTLGCAKNAVDSEGMHALLTRRGYEPVASPRAAEVVIVNTCGFIGPSRDESMGVLREIAGRKRPGQVLIAAGCLPALPGWEQTVRDEQGVDAVIKTQQWSGIADLVDDLMGRDRAPETWVGSRLAADAAADGLIPLPVAEISGDGLIAPFVRTGGKPSAYVKIADGCNHTCAFCTIPSIKGPSVSKRPIAILEEVRALAAAGTREVVFISQNTGAYGQDLRPRMTLAELLAWVCEQVPELPWLRMHYLYPTHINPALIETLASQPQLVPYMDFPLQHAHPEVLRGMGRPSDAAQTRRIIAALRERLPDIALRTTFIVGYPGETEEHFRTLLDFVREMRFDHVGAFTYCNEPGTRAALLPDDVPTEVKQERYARLMEVQREISLAKNRSLVGQTLDVLIEGEGEIEDEDGTIQPISAGRAKRHAPEVDGLVFVAGTHPVGSIIPVRITEADEYDLWGEAPELLAVAAPATHRRPQARRRRHQ
jgi:ribosomal protein S12 methylthiotransferase